MFEMLHDFSWCLFLRMSHTISHVSNIICYAITYIFQREQPVKLYEPVTDIFYSELCADIDHIYIKILFVGLNTLHIFLANYLYQ